MRKQQFDRPAQRSRTTIKRILVVAAALLTMFVAPIAIDYELTYRDLSSTVLQSHIHFGRPAITGGIVLFLCTNLGNAPASVPVPQACPETNPATITGTLTAANVIPLPVVCPTPTTCSGQAIASGAAGFVEMLKAIRAGAAYVNVHTTNHPSGEIRARLGPHGTGHRDDHDHN